MTQPKAHFERSDRLLTFFLKLSRHPPPTVQPLLANTTAAQLY